MSIGDIYVSTNCYRSPDVIKIVGFTAKKVKCTYIPEKDRVDDIYGGSCKINTDFDVTSRPHDFLGKIEDKDSSYECVTYKNKCFFKLNQDKYDRVYTWCQY